VESIFLLFFEISRSNLSDQSYYTFTARHFPDAKQSKKHTRSYKQSSNVLFFIFSGFVLVLQNKVKCFLSPGLPITFLEKEIFFFFTLQYELSSIDFKTNRPVHEFLLFFAPIKTRVNSQSLIFLARKCLNLTFESYHSYLSASNLFAKSEVYSNSILSCYYLLKRE
jgi:hypothetical protein